MKEGVNSIKVKIRVFAYLKENFNIKEATLTVKAGATIKNVLEKFAENYGVFHYIFDEETGGISRRILLAVNGVAVTQLADGLNTRIKEGDVLALIPPVVGG
jgi:MoaD family protein